MKKLNLFLMFFILSSIIVLGDEQTTIGGVWDDYRIWGTGQFNSVSMPNPITDSSLVVQTINIIYAPLVADLDNNGVNEIIVLDTDGVISLYQEYDLTFVDSFDSGDGDKMLVHDVEADGTKNIIVYGDNDINFINWNGTDLYNVSPIHLNDIKNILCRDIDGSCIALYSGLTICDPTPPYTAGMLYAVGFNLTGYSTGSPIVVDAGYYNVACWNHGTGGVVYNANSLGYDEYAVSYSQFVSSGCQAGVVILSQTSLGGAVSVYKTFSPQSNYMPSQRNCFEGDADRRCEVCEYYMTQVSGGLFDGDNTKDLAIGYMGTADTFKIAVYDGDGSSGTAIDTFPELFTADGVLLSPPIFGTFFPEMTGSALNRSVCVAGYDSYDDDIKEIDLLCATITYRGLFLAESDEFKFDVSNWDFNVSTTSYFHRVAYATEMKYNSEGIQDSNLDEIITPYGIFSLDYDNNNALKLEYELTHGSGIFYPNDLLNINRLQILGATDSNLYLINDKWINTGAYIYNGSYIDPCVDAPWKLNTSVHVVVRAFDEEQDNISARVRLYYGETWEQDTGWSNNASGSGVIVFSFTNFVANVTTSSAKIRIEVRDTTNNFYNIDSKEYPFSVTSSNATGIELGECITTFGGLIPDTDECQTNADCSPGQTCINNVCVDIPSICSASIPCPSGYICVDNNCEIISDDVVNAVNTFAFFTGLSVIALFLIVLAWGGYQIVKSNIPPSAKVPAIVLMTFLVIGIGVVMSFISVVWLILFVLVIIAIIGISVGVVIKGRG